MKKRLFLALAAMSSALSLLLGACGAEQTKSAVDTVATELQEQTTIAEPEQSEKTELVISAAASLTESLNEISELYKTAEPDVKLIFNFGASGKLQTQIEEGAPADLFISAAQKQMDTLEEGGFILSETRKNLLENKVVLIVPADSDTSITDFTDAATDKVKMLAVGDPESVPVGQYAQEIFTFLGTWEEIQAKANLGADVKEVLQWTATGNVDCGIVYSTDAATEPLVRVIAEAPAGSHKPVVYPAALISTTEHTEQAQEFLDFLSTDEAAAVFVANGFVVE